MTAFTHYLVIDFEASGVVPDSREWEIVEFPIVVVDAQSRCVLPVEFHSYVRPTRNPILSSACKQNCGILQDDVDQAPDIETVILHASSFVESLALQDSAFAVVTCGDYDLGTALPAESLKKGIDIPKWLQQWVNIKVPFEARFGHKTGMKGMLRHLRLPLEGRHHSGIDDARNIAKLVVALLRDGCSLEITGGSKHLALPTVRDEAEIAHLVQTSMARGNLATPESSAVVHPKHAGESMCSPEFAGGGRAFLPEGHAKRRWGRH
mmetsp:Transcript_32201/g.75614  ORF Transcript_32201/g.75614 Transcript_32201/m.75614 type:complete len:265 (+) Transcript_32201:127-921(+)